MVIFDRICGIYYVVYHSYASRLIRFLIIIIVIVVHIGHLSRRRDRFETVEKYFEKKPTKNKFIYPSIKGKTPRSHIGTSYYTTCDVCATITKEYIRLLTLSSRVHRIVVDG